MKTTAPSRRRTAPSTPARATVPEILVPIDFSPASRAVLAQAVLIARALSARLTVLHVAEPPNYSGSLDELAGAIPAEVSVPVEKLARRVRTFSGRIVPRALAGDILVGQGVAGESIVATARQRHSRLIVCATHGYSGFKRFLLGSTAEYLIRHSPCPVLTLRRPSARRPVTRIRSILAPVDLSAPSREASGYAAAFAARLRARLTLLHVVPPIDDSAGTKRAVARSADKLGELALRLGKHGVKVTTEVATGEAKPAILKAAADTDLIVIATHGRSGLSRILLGSTAEAVIREATCPVLVIRRPQPARLGWFNPLLWFPVAPVMP